MQVIAFDYIRSDIYISACLFWVGSLHVHFEALDHEDGEGTVLAEVLLRSMDLFHVVHQSHLAII